MGDGWRHGDRMAYLFRPLKYGHDAFSQSGLFQTRYLLKAQKAKRFASMKEPDTAYSNSLPGTVHFFPTRKYFKLLTFGSLYWIYDQYLSYLTRLGWKEALTVRPRESATIRLMWTPLRTDCWVADTVGVGQWCGSDEAPVTWWRGPGRGGAHKTQTWSRGTFLPRVTKKLVFARRFFMENNDCSN